MPNKVPVEVLNVWLDQDEVGYLVGGENARVRLKDISDEDIQPGYVLSPPRCAPPPRPPDPPARPPASARARRAPSPARLTASHRRPSAGPTACAAHKRFEVQLIVVELLEHKSIFSAGYTAILHVAAAAEECSIVELTSEIDKKSGKKSKKKPMFVKSGTPRAQFWRNSAQFCAIL